MRRKRKFKLRKDDVEEMCLKSGVHAAYRDTFRGYDIFVSDGFSAFPARDFRRFGVEPGEFPWGAFCTIWWVASGEEHFDAGMPMLFDAFHNPEFDIVTKRRARINTALQEARSFIIKRANIRANGLAKVS